MFGSIVSMDVLQTMLRDMADGDPQKAQLFSSLGMMYQSKFDRSGDRSDIDAAITNAERSVDLWRAVNFTRLPQAMSNLALLFHRRFQHFQDPSDLSKQLRLFQDAVTLLPEGHPDLAPFLSNLATCHTTFFDLQREVLHLDRAIAVISRLIALPHSDKFHHLIRLVKLLHTRYEISPEQAFLDQCIAALQQTIEMASDYEAEKFRLHGNLAGMLDLRFQHTGVMVDLNQSISAYEKALALSPPHDPEKSSYLSGLGCTLATRFQRLGTVEDIKRAVSSLEQALALTPKPRADYAIVLDALYNALMLLLEKADESGDVKGAITAVEQVVELTPTGNARKATLVGTLANAIARIRAHKGILDIALLDKAIKAQRQILDSPSDNLPVASHIANHSTLGSLLILRFDAHGNDVDLEAAVEIYRRTVTHTPDGHPSRPKHISNLGSALARLFEAHGRAEDLDEAIILLEEAAGSMPEDEKPKCLGELGKALTQRAGKSEVIDDLIRAIEVHSEALAHTPDGHPEQPLFLLSYAMALHRRYERLKDIADLTEAISTFETVSYLIPEGHASRAVYLPSHAGVLETRFDVEGNTEDLDMALELREQALTLTPPNHPHRAKALGGLGMALKLRRSRTHTGGRGDIDRSVALLEEALSITQDSDPLKPEFYRALGVLLAHRYDFDRDIGDLHKGIDSLECATRLTSDGNVGSMKAREEGVEVLGRLLGERFTHLADMSDVDRAVTLLDQVVERTPEENVSVKVARLTYLGNTLRKRYRYRHEEEDISLSITVLEKAVTIALDDGKALYQLGSSLLLRFDSLHRIDDLDRAIALMEQATERVPDDDREKPQLLNNLGAALRARIQFLHSDDEPTPSIVALERAISLVPDTDPIKPISFSELSAAYAARFQNTLAAIDIDSAIVASEQARALTFESYPDRAGFTYNLGETFYLRFKFSGDGDDLERAIYLYREAATGFAGRPTVQLKAASAWANRVSTHHGPSKALEAYTVLLNLIPRVAWLGSTIVHRHEELQSIGNMVNEAAAAAVEAEELTLAVEWLEQGRSVVWGQLLNLRTPVDDLREVDAVLADDLDVIFQSTSGSTTYRMSQADQRSSQEKIAQKRRRLAEEWEKAIESARKIPGFEDFLQPKRFSKLLPAARRGPVVLLNVGAHRCDALILLEDLEDVVHVPLETFSLDMANKLHRRWRHALLESQVLVRSESVRASSSVYGAECQRIFARALAVLWQQVVKPVIDGLALSVASAVDAPRAWWCPTGVLNFLPIHAAGLYNTSEEGSKIYEYVVSSYAPTVATLIDTQRARPTEFHGVLAVSQPATPGQISIPKTVNEARLIKQYAPKEGFTWLNGSEATRERVIAGMATHSWIHLACHAVQDAREPTRSAFCLHDDKLKLIEVIRAVLPYAAFAFLSACQTASGDVRLSEEAVHLAAGMLMAGYRGVVATMWSIWDDVAPLVSDEVYARLFKTGEGAEGPDSAEAARALHEALASLRANPKVGETAFLLWVPFIHLGI